jgi:Tol biopolymer transport system component
VAFVWDGGKPLMFDLYIQMVGGSDPLRLTETPVHEYSPAWSPDGRQIAFLRELGVNADESEVVVIPALGGSERRLTTIATVDSPGGAWYRGSPGPRREIHGRRRPRVPCRASFHFLVFR